MTDELLPALPEPVSQCYVFDEEYGHRDLDASDDYYTADQLRAYAREAIRLAQGCEVVTRESAEAAIEHVAQHNGPGREAEALRMLVEPSPPAGEVA